MGVDTLDELMNLVPGFQSYRSALSGVSYPYSARGRRIGFPGAEILMVIELELNQQVDTHLLISASYTHLLERPASSFREAASWASLLMNYQYRLINFNILATYHGTQQTPSGNSATNTLNEYWLLNSKIKYQHSANIKSYIQIKNLLDKVYLTPATGSSIIEGTPNRGREILTGISWEF